MEALGLDYKLFLAQIINFALFLFIFKKFISKPFFEYLDKKKLQETEKHKILADLEARQEKVKEEEKEIIKEAQTKAVRIIKEAKAQSLLEREETVKKAQSEALSIREKAKKTLQIEEARLNEEVKTHMAGLASEIAKSALTDFIDEPRQKEIVENILTKYKGKKIHDN